jgi:hypothetical protein
MAVQTPREVPGSSATKRRAEDDLQSERTQFRKMVEGALLEVSWFTADECSGDDLQLRNLGSVLQREEREESSPPRTAEKFNLSQPLLPIEDTPTADQGISFNVDTLNALLPNMDGYHQGLNDPLQALLQGADLSILENFLLYPPQSFS